MARSMPMTPSDMASVHTGADGSHDPAHQTGNAATDHALAHTARHTMTQHMPKSSSSAKMPMGEAMMAKTTQS